VPAAVGLPGPISDAAPLRGGDTASPWDDTGDRTGDGERLAVADKLMNCAASRSVSACSACTTSAKEMKDKRRGSCVSSDA
jgi:hypothetical protein